MNAEVFSEWMEERGQRVVRSSSSYWHEQGPRTFQAFPYHWIFQPEPGEIDDLLREWKAVAVRYSTPLNSPEGVASYHAVFEEPTYEIERLGKWARKNVRRGLRNCEVRLTDFRNLTDRGWPLQRDTLYRQGRRSGMDENDWKRLCEVAAGLPGFEAWGAFCGDVLAASVIVFQMDDWCYMLFQQCHADYLAQHVNNALSFEVTKAVIDRESVSAILYGLHSLDAPPSVDEFKIRMGYSAKPVRQRVAFHPMLRPLVNRATYGMVRAAKRLRSNSTTLSKAEGIVRFCIQGKEPLGDQDWPAHVNRPSDSVGPKSRTPISDPKAGSSNAEKAIR